MIAPLRIRHLRRLLLSAATTVALAVGVMVGTAGTSQAATSLPCDIYGAAGTPCVAAHSTTRALYAAYNGPLYQVKRASDGTTADISTLAAGGYANAAAQDSFCAGTSCIITEIYDQSPKHNNLTIEGAGGNGKADVGADANALPITVGGHKVYGLYVIADTGYRDDATTGVATGAQPEGEYMVASGTHVNNQCCFDYGNAETNNKDNGNGHMDAVNLGTWCQLGPCYKSGPWVMADLENGLFAGGNGSNLSNTGNSSTFVTAMTRNNGTTAYAIKGGNAQTGALTTWYDGALPSNRAGYAPMRKEGAIVLGTGGDDSNGSIGSFFEGIMTAGYPTDAADNAVQANIVAAGYQPSATTGEVHAIGLGKCMVVPNSTTTVGTQVQTQYCGTGSNQIWTRTSSNELTVYSGSTQRCLDASGGQTTAGTHVVISSCTGSTEQQWNFNANGTITGVQSGLCLDITGAGGSANGPLQLWSCNGGNWQQWTLG